MTGLPGWRKAALAASSLVLMILAACSGGGDGQGQTGTDTGAGGSVPGEPAPAGRADRRIAVSALDTLRFAPASVHVKRGETVTFVITNEGNNDHEFVLGDRAYQVEHDREMSEHGAEHGEAASPGPNVVEVGSGETKRLTWSFDEPGEVLFGCHEPGHYDGGMVGKISIS
jgi:uncharacterized cupredoxin-like copper-binding protein